MLHGLCFSGVVLAVMAIAMPAQAQEVPGGNASVLRPVKAGDEIVFQRRDFVQPDPTVPAVLEEKVKSDTMKIIQEADGTRGFEASNGRTEIYDQKYTLVRLVKKNGEQIEVDPAQTIHWMPEGELKPGMKWKFKNEWTTKTSGGRDCYHTETFTAVSKAVTQDLSIAGTPVHVDAVEVTLNGEQSSRSGKSDCAGNGLLTAKTIVYSKDLDLVLVNSSLVHDEFNKMRGNSNRMNVVTSIK